MSRLTINSNIASLNAQRNFTTATKKLSESYTRLSSGLRINRAVDDAAGLSISESLKADTRLFNQGVRNLNDGVSLLNIADSALGELSNIIIRLRELATQSANGTLGNKQRLALDQEAQALSKEYNRIARTTEFNGRKLFDGGFGDLSLAAGGGVSSLIIDGLGGAIGDGTFKNAESYSAVANVVDSAVADLNRDGIFDIITTSDSVAGVFIQNGNANGTFSSAFSYSIPIPVRTIIAQDFNNDGIVDIFAGADSAGFVLLGNANGTFKSSMSFVSSFSIINTAKSNDVNNDGILDIVGMSSGTSGDISVVLGNGDGTFKSTKFYSTSTNAFDVDVADLNGDGISDLISAELQSNKYGIALGNGDGTFKARTSYDSIFNISRLSHGDFNNDGLTDFITVNPSHNAISLFYGNGDGTFLRGGSFLSQANVASLDSGDVNGDGVLDIVAGSSSTGHFEIFIGKTSGGFNAAVSFSAGSGMVGQGQKDFNGDGVLDLVAVNKAQGTIGVLLGNATNGVGALQPFSLKTKSDSKDAMTYFESALTRLIKQRGHIGAFQSRIETATNNLHQAALAYSEANSRITDVDVAEESSKLTANQIIQQAAASVLGQANQQPRLVLQLLQGI